MRAVMWVASNPNDISICVINGSTQGGDLVILALGTWLMRRLGHVN